MFNASATAAERDPVPANNTVSHPGVRFIEEADLSATVVAAPAAVDVGYGTEYTVTVHNAGPEAATAAAVNVQFGANDTYVLAQGSLANCTGSPDQTLHCPLATLQSGETKSWRWNVTTGPTVGSRSLSATLVVDPDHTHDPNAANNTALATLDVRAANDLAIQLTPGSNAVTRGTHVTYILSTTNGGVIPAQNVTPKLLFTAGMQFISGSGATCSATADTVTCDAGTLAAGASGDVQIVMDTIATGANLVTASVSSLHPDPNAGNNTASATLTIAPFADVGVTLAAGATAVTQNAALAYTLTANNTATSDATAATAHVTLSNLLTYSSATGATCTHAAGVVTCDLGSLAPNASLVVTINTTAATAGTANSSADITSAAFDPVTGNNLASAAAVTISAPPPPPPPPSSSSSGGGGKKGGGGAFDALTAMLLAALVIAMGRRGRRVRD